MSATNANPAINPAIIPLAVLCGILVVGGVAAVFITRRIARVRLLLELRWAAEAKAADERLGDKPVLADVYVGSSPDLSSIEGEGKLPWTVVQPISAALHPEVSSPHPHRTIENRPGYARSPLIDGNVLQVSVGIVMPSAFCPGEGEEAALHTLDYCIGTSDVVVCTLLSARQRLIGIN